MEILNLQAQEELADFYVMEHSDMLNKNGEFEFPETPILGVRHTDVEPEDYFAIVQFGRIIKNYQKMNRLHTQSYYGT